MGQHKGYINKRAVSSEADGKNVIKAKRVLHVITEAGVSFVVRLDVPSEQQKDYN